MEIGNKTNRNMLKTKTIGSFEKSGAPNDKNINISKILEISVSQVLDCFFCSEFLDENLGRRKL